ncbi:YbaB/EbfC family nucleoid-associated protein [Saccharopolyspora taberi]|uniref:YbaB/EbfC family DNA-binding protein n=1 Tax=Saccharopolyspora taberi TaxID=60895 RepID=A0ABN3V753_9PSEU
MHPDDWLSQYNAKLQKAKDDADRAKSLLSEIGGSATSKDGQVTVRVNSSGVLEDISFGRDFQHPQPEKVAASIMECVRQAQRQAAGQMMEVMQEFAGGDALEFVRSNLPHGYAGDGNDPAETPAGTSRPGHDDYDDFDDNSSGGFLR